MIFKNCPGMMAAPLVYVTLASAKVPSRGVTQVAHVLRKVEPANNDSVYRAGLPPS